MNHRGIWLLLAGAVAGGPELLSAQTQPPTAKVRLWSISSTMGGSSGKSSGAVEEALRAGGFDDRENCLCAAGRANPYSSGGGLGTSTFTVRRALGKSAYVQIVTGIATSNVSFGYKEAPNIPSSFSLTSNGTFVYLEQSVTSFAVLASIGVRGDAVWVAAGPEIHTVYLKQTQDNGGAPWEGQRIGATIAAGLTYPRHRRGFAMLQVQQHFVSSFDTAPITIPAKHKGPAGTLAPFNIDFNHRTWGIGGGFRF